MAARISNDRRERVVAARFEVAAFSVVKWTQRHRASRSVHPAKMGAYRKRILEPHHHCIAERLGQNPHLTLHGLKAELASRGITVFHIRFGNSSACKGLRFK